ncbi:MAG: 5-amino-6-(D-ribitylamino)uracil--L-tyrosine 4-hydroxyphenyl transferase CofH [Candidatus Bathyarchaeota archaeon]
MRKVTLEMVDSPLKTIRKASYIRFNRFIEKFFSVMDPVIAGILDRALGEREISFKDGIELMKAKGVDLESLILVANWIRYKRVGDFVTYVVNRNINLTNICVAGCKFCAYSRTSEAQDSYLLSMEEVGRKVREAQRQGVTEICIQGGLHPELDAHYYEKLVKAIKEEAPKIHIHGFSPMEIFYGASKAGLSVQETLVMLKKAGLDSIPGTAAEILVDDIRRQICPNKIKTQTWVDIVKTSHKLGIPTTSTIMYGHLERPEHRIAHLVMLRDIQKETNGFTELVPLTFVHWNTPLSFNGVARTGATGAEDLKMHAISRIMLNGWINNIQVSWVKLGMKFAQVALNAGGNDFGGTLMEENISTAAGAKIDRYPTPEEFRSLISDIGRIPVQRTTTYKIIKKY